MGQRNLRLCVAVAALAVGLCARAWAQDASEAGGMFTDPSFEQVNEQGQPALWQLIDFGTGGTGSIAADGGKTGQRYAMLKAETVEQRSCWRLKEHIQLWDDTNSALTVGGWYRTRGYENTPGKGASVRVLFNDDPKVWHHLDIKTAYYPPAADWTRVETTFPVPKGTRAIVVEYFHWFIPGETHWDDVWARPATTGEIAAGMAQTLGIDREPEHGRNLPYSPADGSTVQLNPPPFLWLPASGEVTYRLQIDRSPRFDGDGLIEHKGLIWACEMLTEQLATGTWYWRYGVDTAQLPTQWSTARAFEVPKEADPWPYPGREALKVPVARPHLFINADKLPELRRRAREGDLKATAENLVKLVQGFAGEEIVPEPDMLPPANPERVNAYSKVMGDTRRPMDRMEQAGLAYLLTGDAACGQEAKRRLLHFFSWNPQGSTGYFHNDEPAMWIMMRGTRAYDWTYDLFTEQERKVVEGAMRVRAADMYKMLRAMPFENNPYSSHPGRTIGFLGEAALEFLNEWEEAPEYLDYITHIYWGVYPAWGKDDGGWNEGPGYWSAYMSFALHFVLALREATGINLAERPFFKNTPYYALYLTPPHGQMSPFGDGTQWKPSPATSLMYWFSTLTQDPFIRWYPDSLNGGPGTSMLGVLLKDDTLTGRAPADLPLARHFEGVGLVSMHTDLVDGDNDVHLAMRSSPYGAVSHGHNDQNCFVLEAYGEALAIASGYYPQYGCAHHDRWTRQTKAKCGITYDGGQGQDRGWHAQGKVTGFIHGQGFDLMAADATKAYGGRLSRAIREIVHVRPGIFVVRDDLASTEARTWEYWLHAIDEMSIREVDGAVLIKRPKASLTARFVYPETLSFAQTDEFDPHPDYPPGREYAKNWHLTASYTQPSREAEFLSVLLPARAGDEGHLPATEQRLTDSVRAVELTWADGSRTVVGFRRPGVEGSLTLGEIQTDADVFAVSYAADGTVKGTMSHGGTMLKVE